MSVARSLLEDLARIDATIKRSGDHLILRAGSKPVPGALVKRLEQGKAEVLAVISPDAHYWDQRFTALTCAWSVGKRDWQTARRLAWGDLQNEWHKNHGRQWPQWQCAGCGKPIGGLDVVNLPDGNRVHFEPIDCMIDFGRRWRGDARRALVGLGIEPPDFE
jgi:hypothetical protein